MKKLRGKFRRRKPFWGKRQIFQKGEITYYFLDHYILNNGKLAEYYIGWIGWRRGSWSVVYRSERYGGFQYRYQAKSWMEGLYAKDEKAKKAKMDKIRKNRPH